MANDGGSFARHGWSVLTQSATAYTGSWYAIKAGNGADATVTTVNSQGDNFTSLTIPNGDVIEVQCTSITVSSGTILAAKNKP